MVGSLRSRVRFDLGRCFSRLFASFSMSISLFRSMSLPIDVVLSFGFELVWLLSLFVVDVVVDDVIGFPLLYGSVYE